MKRQFLFFLSLVFLLGSCADDVNVEIINNPDSPGSPSDDFGYFYPLKVGNSWTSEIETQGQTRVSTTEIIGSEVRNDTTFYQLRAITDNIEITGESFYINGHGWTISSDDSHASLGSFSLLILDDNIIAGESWNFTIETEIQNFTTLNRYEFDGVEVLNEYTVNGEVFSDVKKIDVNVFTSSDLLPDEIHTITGVYYWAKGVGLIENTLSTLSGPLVTGDDSTTRLTDYTIS